MSGGDVAPDPAGRRALARTSRALRASGLTRVWAVRYPPLREPEAAAPAARHVAGSLAATAPPYRAAFIVVLRLVPAAFRLVTGRRLDAASPNVLSAGAARLERLPVLGTVVRTIGALACHGALDGVRPAVPVPAAGTELPERAWPNDPR
ncbi:hypothetical protein B4N89_43325 [Embleya scabrispora]|uniref:Uncharacterized protein n=1 Tax=Embleya scabrispora TaxID=159449 RepID=A0A1T3NKI2_9ACTN|nr:hypothetical protein [Embleya scabrispora]OPC77353.1 hypothetical protein B4N89_43325 [Embleya scabrispora]